MYVGMDTESNEMDVCRTVSHTHTYLAIINYIAS
jgi:hypothetical protein